MKNFSSSFKNSFKSHGSYKHQDQHSRKISIEKVDDDPVNEERPILSDRYDFSSDAMMTNDHHEVIVKIDGCNNGQDEREVHSSSGNNNNNIIINDHKVWKEISYESWNVNNNNNDDDGGGGGKRRNLSTTTDQYGFEFTSGNYDIQVQDPPSRQFLNKQRDAAVPETMSSVDGERVSTSKELKVSFQDPSFDGKVVDVVFPDHRLPPAYGKEDNETTSSDEHDDDDDHSKIPRYPEYRSRRVSTMNETDDHQGQVLKCSSFQKRGSMVRLKTRSRILDDPSPGPDRQEIRAEMRGKSGILKSGLLGKGSVSSGMLLGKAVVDEEEDDPLFDEDIPDEYKRAKLNALTLAQCLILVIIVSALFCTLAIQEWKAKKFRGLALWKWEVLVLVLISGRLLSGWGVRIVVFCIERNFLLRKRVLYFVYGVRKAVQNCIWLGLVLIAWHSMFDQRVEGNNKFLRHVNNLMLCMLIASLLWLLKTLMVKVLASSFHVSTFFDRIQESLFNQYVIETLSGPPLIEMQNNLEDEQMTFEEIAKFQKAGATLPPELTRPPPRSGGLPPKPARGISLKISGPIASKKQPDDTAGITIDHLHRLNPKNISAWNMTRLMKIVRHGALSTLDEQIMGTNSQYDESGTQIKSEFEANIAARKIFRNVAKTRARFIYMEDLMRFLREEEAVKTLDLIEGSSESERISKASLKTWVINAFRERRALALTLNDTKTAVNKLHHMVNALVGVIIGIIWIVILGIAPSQVLVLITSQVVVAAFIFGNTCKTIFESIIFLFVMHPYDVGDRCEIDGTQMIVEEINILTTVFLRGSDNQRIYYPNSNLLAKPIHNFYRSPDMWDIIEFYIHVATPPEKIPLLKQRLTSYVDSKKEHWYAGPIIVTMYLDDLNKLRMSIWARHKMNLQDSTERWMRRGSLCEEMVKIFKELDIDYGIYPFNVNIRNMPPTNLNRIPPTW